MTFTDDKPRCMLFYFLQMKKDAFKKYSNILAMWATHSTTKQRAKHTLVNVTRACENMFLRPPVVYEIDVLQSLFIRRRRSMFDVSNSHTLISNPNSIMQDAFFYIILILTLIIALAMKCICDWVKEEHLTWS